MNRFRLPERNRCRDATSTVGVAPVMQAFADDDERSLHMDRPVMNSKTAKAIRPIARTRAHHAFPRQQRARYYE